MWPFKRKARFSDALKKAMTAGTGTDAAAFEGGRAVTKESLSGAAGTRKRKKKRRKYRRLADLLSDYSEKGAS